MSLGASRNERTRGASFARSYAQSQSTLTSREVSASLDMQHARLEKWALGESNRMWGKSFSSMDLKPHRELDSALPWRR